MKNFASGTGIGVAVAATGLAIAWWAFIPYGHAWVAIACAAAVWVIVGFFGKSPSMSEVISGVEGETPRSRPVTQRSR